MNYEATLQKTERQLLYYKYNINVTERFCRKQDKAVKLSMETMKTQSGRTTVAMAIKHFPKPPDGGIIYNVTFGCVETDFRLQG